MDINQIFSSRLQHVRKLRGMSLRDLAAATGNTVSVQTLSNYEKGVSFPNGAVMTALTDALSVSIDALFRETEVQWENICFSYRKRKSITDKKADQITAQVRDYAERYMEIENILAITPDASFRDKYLEKEVHTTEDARMVADAVRRDYNLGESPIASLHEFLEGLGVKVIGLDVNTKFDGVNFVCNEHSFIIYNSRNESAERTRFTIAHELGHLLLEILDEVDEDNAEKLCHSFASELLLPQKKLIAILGNKRDRISLVELKRIRQLYGISIEAILYAACEIGIITKERHSQFRKIINSNVKIKDEVAQTVYPPEPDNQRFTSLVYRALSNNVISESKAAVFLDKPIEEVINDQNIIC